MRDLERSLSEFNKIVSPEVCNALAKKCKFVQRSTSKIQGYEFAQAMTIPNAFLESETLHSLAVRMRSINESCNLSNSALAQRINTKGAESFMKACLGLVIKNVLKKHFDSLQDLPNLSHFNSVYIQDSTKAELDEKLSPDFKGSGGVASKASVKIDCIFEYLSEQIADIDFCSGNKPDQSLAGRLIPMLKKDDLVIRDLGYFIINSLRQIEEKGAYYVSRWKVNECVYESKEAKEPLDLAKFLDKRAVDGVVDVQVFIGKERLPVRLVACLLSEEAARKRFESAHRDAKRRGTKISKKKMALLRYSIFITDVPSEILCKKSIIAVYGLRWRIELVFKQWKSCLKIDMFKGYNKERFHCFLYGRLVMIFLFGALYPPLMRYALGLGRELSSYKLLNYLIADHALFRAFQEGTMEKLLENLLKDIPRRLCMDKRKRLSLRANVRSGNTSYDLLSDFDDCLLNCSNF